MTNALVVIESLNAPVVFLTPDGVEDVLRRLETEARERARSLDISTEKGRRAIASLAYEVARSKTALDELGKGLVETAKREIAKVDAERRRIRAACDALKDEVRQPLTVWEEADERRVADHEAHIQLLVAAGVFAHEPTSGEIRQRQADLAALWAQERDWQEFRIPAYRAYEEARDALAARLVAVEQAEQAAAAQREAERIEQQRLQQERDARIAAEARVRAEEEAAAREARLKADAEAERQRIEREKEAAEARANREAAKREADKKAAAERLVREKEAAAQRERDRLAKEQERERLAAQKREESERNRKRVTKAITEALTREADIPAAHAGLVADALLRGTIPHIKIEW